MRFRELYMGIDPGKDGGIAVICPGDTTPVYTDRLRYFLENPTVFREFLRHFRWSEFLGGIRLCAMEQIPKGFPGSRGVHSSLTMGINWGLLKGVLVASGIDLVCPLPQEWQKKVLGPKKVHDDSKAASIARARVLYPGVDLLPGKCRKPHDGIADAVCLAEYAKNFNG